MPARQVLYHFTHFETKFPSVDEASFQSVILQPGLLSSWVYRPLPPLLKRRKLPDSARLGKGEKAKAHEFKA